VRSGSPLRCRCLAVPTRFSSDVLCCSAWVRYRHEPADRRCPLNGRYRMISGQHMLNVSSSHFDPHRGAFLYVGWQRWRVGTRLPASELTNPGRRQDGRRHVPDRRHSRSSDTSGAARPFSVWRAVILTPAEPSCPGARFRCVLPREALPMPEDAEPPGQSLPNRTERAPRIICVPAGGECSLNAVLRIGSPILRGFLN
jgi:hypothetical protein